MVEPGVLEEVDVSTELVPPSDGRAVRPARS